MAAIFANDKQWSSANLNSHTNTDNKFRFVEADTLTKPKCHHDHIRSLMLSKRGALPQEQAV